MKLFKSGSFALFSTGVFVALFAMGCPRNIVECSGASGGGCDVATESCAEIGDDTLCLPNCSADNPCPEGFACTQHDDPTKPNVNNPNVCVEIEDDFEEGRDCVFDIQCASGACIGDNNVRVCFEQCTGDEDCDQGKLCYVFGGRNVCETPEDDPKAVDELCTSPTQCDSRRCVTLPHFDDGEDEDDVPFGRCLASCESIETCAVNENCAELIQGGQVCVQLAESGGVCTTPDTCADEGCIDVDGSGGAEGTCSQQCNDTGICPEGLACFPEANNGGRDFCVPLNGDGNANGETCNDNRDCQSGQCRIFPVPAGGEDTQTLCGEPCDGANQCGEGRECWIGEEGFNGPDVCGPAPQ